MVALDKVEADNSKESLLLEKAMIHPGKIKIIAQSLEEQNNALIWNWRRLAQTQWS